MPNIEQLLYQTDKSSHRRCSLKKAILKKFHNIYKKTPVLESLFQLKKRLQLRCFPVAKYLGTPMLKNIWL